MMMMIRNRRRVIGAIPVTKDHVLVTPVSALHGSFIFLFSHRAYEANIIITTCTTRETESQRGLVADARHQRQDVVELNRNQALPSPMLCSLYT